MKTRILRKLSLVAVLASGVALAQSTPPPPTTGGPATGAGNEPQPRPGMENDKPGTDLGQANSGTGGSGDTRASSSSSSSKKSKSKKQHKSTNGTPSTDTSSGATK